MAVTLGYVYAASISATLNIQQGGTNVVSAKQFSTVTLQYSFTIDPVSTATGNVYYKYSAAPFDADDDATMEAFPTYLSLPFLVGMDLKEHMILQYLTKVTMYSS
jgi:hypothetical protein